MSALALLAAAALGPTAGFEGVVMKVVDGGIVRIQPVGERKWKTVHLIGVQAPIKATRDADGQEPWGTRAQQFLSLLATRQKVRVEFDIQREIDDAVWGYVWLDDVLLNEEVLKAGHGLLATRSPNVKYVERLREAAQSARTAQRGIFDPTEPLPQSPDAFTERQPDPAPMSTALNAWQEGCIIGNRKSKVYHFPGGRYYEGMKQSKDAVFFRTSDDAEKEGYKKAAR